MTGEQGSEYLLIGMLDSPFVRRVAIALELAQVAYQNLPLRTVGDADAFKQYSPLKRAPTLVLPGGEVLFDSELILQHLKDLHPKIGELMPRGNRPEFALGVLGAAMGLGDKAVSAIYEKVFHPAAHRSDTLLKRLEGQLTDTCQWLEERAPARGWLTGSALTIADVTVGTTVRFATEAHPDVLDLKRYQRLHDWCARLEELPEFKKTYLALEPPQG